MNKHKKVFTVKKVVVLSKKQLNYLKGGKDGVIVTMDDDETDVD